MTDLNTLASSALVDLYNKLVPMAATNEMPLAPVKKFSDKATAVKRVTRILSDVNQVREKDEMLPFVISEDGSLVELPESGAPSTGSAGFEEQMSVASEVMERNSEVLSQLAVSELRDSGALDARVAEADLGELAEAGKKSSESAEAVTETPSNEGVTTPETVPVEAPPVDVSIAKVRAPRAAPKPRAKQNPGGRPALVGLTDIISLQHTEANPKRAEAARRFAKYKDGMSVQEYADAVGNKRQALRDVAWDMKMGWVSVSGAPKARRVKEVPAEAVEESAATGETVEGVAPQTEATESSTTETESESVTSQAA